MPTSRFNTNNSLVNSHNTEDRGSAAGNSKEILTLPP